MSKLSVIHAVSLMKMVDGSWRLYGFTRCGIPSAQVGLAAVSADPNEVSCKRCRGARSWPYFYSQYLEHQRQGRLPSIPS
jgi:hypothetical protein